MRTREIFVSTCDNSENVKVIANISGRIVQLTKDTEYDQVYVNAEEKCITLWNSKSTDNGQNVSKSKKNQIINLMRAQKLDQIYVDGRSEGMSGINLTFYKDGLIHKEGYEDSAQQAISALVGKLLEAFPKLKIFEIRLSAEHCAEYIIIEYGNGMFSASSANESQRKLLKIMARMILKTFCDGMKIEVSEDSHRQFKESVKNPKMRCFRNYGHDV